MTHRWLLEVFDGTSVSERYVVREELYDWNAQTYEAPSIREAEHHQSHPRAALKTCSTRVSTATGLTGWLNFNFVKWCGSGIGFTLQEVTVRERNDSCEESIASGRQLGHQ